jgi:hypothetical protein
MKSASGCSNACIWTITFFPSHKLFLNAPRWRCIAVTFSGHAHQIIELNFYHIFSIVQTAIFRHCEGVLALTRSNLSYKYKIASPPKDKIGGSQ